MKLQVISICLFGLIYSGFAQTKGDKLYDAIVKSENDQVYKLINKGADVNFIKASGPWLKVSLLITAVNNKNFDIVKSLLDNNANIHWKDGFNTSAIMYAANTGNIEIVKLLLQNGADINDNDGQGNTVLTASKKSKNQDLVSFVELKIKESFLEGDIYYFDMHKHICGQKFFIKTKNDTILTTNLLDLEFDYQELPIKVDLTVLGLDKESNKRCPSIYKYITLKSIKRNEK